MDDSEVAAMIWEALGAAAIALAIAFAFAWFLTRKRLVYRNELSRIYELRDLLPSPLPPTAYFRDFDETLLAWPQKLKQFRDIEQELQGLDATAWAYLKTELTPLLITRDKTRGWQPLFDKLNQAKAYNYLASLGCIAIRFVPESKIKGQRTPDLEASAQSGLVLCEVKTINVSDDEANRLHNGGVSTTTDQLTAAFFRKLSCSVSQASAQMKDYRADIATKRLVYIIVNFDDRLNECANSYKIQMYQFMPYITPPELEVQFDIKPEFYSALA